MSLKKVVFLGSKPIGYQCFAYLLAMQEKLGIEITGLITHSRKEFGDAQDLNELAIENNIPILENEDAIPECDIIYSVQHHRILTATQISKATQAAVNLHMAPLPEYRGSNQFSFAILDGKKEFGTTIHLIDPRIDHGDLLFQKRFPIPAGCWVYDLYQLTFNASIKLFTQTLGHIIKGIYTPVSQESLIHKYGTSLHLRKEINELKVIDMDWDKKKIERHILATSMPGFEPPYCIINGQKVYLTTVYP